MRPHLSEYDPAARPHTPPRRSASAIVAASTMGRAARPAGDRAVRGYKGLAALAASHGLNLEIKVPPSPPMLPPKTALGAQTRLEVACVAYLGRRLRVEPT